MEHTIKYDEQRNLCIMSITGEIHRETDAVKIKMIALKTGFRNILFDFREATIIANPFSTYRAVDDMVKGEVPEKMEYKLALLYAGEVSQRDYLEDLLVGRGFAPGFFSDYDEALAYFEDSSFSKRKENVI